MKTELVAPLARHLGGEDLHLPGEPGPSSVLKRGTVELEHTRAALDSDPEREADVFVLWGPLEPGLAQLEPLQFDAEETFDQRLACSDLLLGHARDGNASVALLLRRGCVARKGAREMTHARAPAALACLAMPRCSAWSPPWRAGKRDNPRCRVGFRGWSRPPAAFSLVTSSAGGQGRQIVNDHREIAREDLLAESEDLRSEVEMRARDGQ